MNRAERPAAAIAFTKVEGGGNDFVLVDARNAPADGVEWWNAARIRRLLDRHRGVGGDGLLVLARAPRGGATLVRFWNPDGGRAAFCGNGARCVAAWLLEGASPGVEVAFRFGRPEIRAARSAKGRYRVLLPPARRRALPSAPPLSGLLQRLGSGRRETSGPMAPRWIDTGVPHLVVPLRDRAALERLDLAEAAPPLRAHPAFGPAGTNVDFVAVDGAEILLRTFERGVEGETLACGSGLAAAGIWAAESGASTHPVRLRARGGDRFRLERDRDGRMWLEGPARIVFHGRIER